MLTSSAIGGRKAPPKAPPRRRNVPQNTAETAPPERVVENVERVDEVPVPTATNQSDAVIQAVNTDTRLPSPPIVEERPVTEIDEHDLETLAPAIRTSIEHIEEASELVQRDRQADGAVTNSNEPTESVGTSEARKTRKRGAPTAGGRRSSKRLRTEEEPQAQSSEVVAAASESASAANNAPAAATRKRRRTAGRNVGTEEVPAQDMPLESTREGQTSETSAPSNAATAAAQRESASELNEAAAVPSSTVARPRRSRKSRENRREDTDQGAADETAEVVEDISDESESDPEQHEIDPSTLSMFDLSYDARHGRTSARERKMAKIDWAAVAEKRREEADAIQRGDRRREQENGPGTANVTEATEADQQHEEGNRDDAAREDGARARPGPMTRASTGGVRFRIVGGQIVEDETSLTIDRAARIEETINDTAGEPAEEEENLTFRLNRTTYMNDRRRDETERVPNFRRKSDAWSEEETDRFYDALRHFGTDFFIISKMFPPKTRRHIKMKFVREERLEPDRINAVLLGQADPRNRINLAEYAQAIDRDVTDFQKYDGLDHANEVIKASMKDKEEEMRAAVKQEEESIRQRELQRQQREKQKLEMEKKRDERNRKKQLKRRGEIYSTGTFGAADDEEDFASFRPPLGGFDDE